MPSQKYLDEHTEDTLKSTHELYDKYNEEWEFLNAAYEGTRALLAYGALTKHERESQINFNRRSDEAYGFSYSRSIVDLYNSFLSKKEQPRTIPDSVGEDILWLNFMDDCDMYDTDFDDFFIDQSRQSSIQGHTGILVDMPSTEVNNMEEQIAKGIYPYLAAYNPINILDWEYERDATGRPVLIYLKLLDDDGFYRIWTQDVWEVWEIKEEEVDLASLKTPYKASNTTISPTGRGAEKIREGVNALGEIPFVILYNQRSTIDKEIGISDVVDVSRIDASIIRNLSQIEEIVNYAAFPMMRKPMREAGGDIDDQVGPTAVLEFDPDNPDSKPDWLDSTVGEPVRAILDVIAKKIEEIYRSTNVGGLNAMEVQNQARSGVALKAEFQMLNSKLVKKSKAIAQAKSQCIGYWLKWLGAYDKLFEEFVFEHVNTFEIEDLATDLENILTAGAVVTLSPTFTAETQKVAARLVLPSAEDEVVNQIDDEIDENVLREAEMREAAMNAYLQGTTPEGEGGNGPPEQIPNAEVVEGEEDNEE